MAMEQWNDGDGTIVPWRWNNEEECFRMRQEPEGMQSMTGLKA